MLYLWHDHVRGQLHRNEIFQSFWGSTSGGKGHFNSYWNHQAKTTCQSQGTKVGEVASHKLWFSRYWLKNKWNMDHHFWYSLAVLQQPSGMHHTCEHIHDMMMWWSMMISDDVWPKVTNQNAKHEQQFLWDVRASILGTEQHIVNLCWQHETNIWTEHE